MKADCVTSRILKNRPLLLLDLVVIPVVGHLVRD